MRAQLRKVPSERITGGRRTNSAGSISSRHNPRGDHPRVSAEKVIYDLSVEYFVGMPSWQAAG